LSCVPFTETITFVRRSYSYVDFEAEVTFDETIDVQANVQHPSTEEVQSLLEGERITRKPIDVRVAKNDIDPRIADQQDDEVSDLVDWRGEYYELKARRLHTMVIPHWYLIGVRIDVDRIDGLPP